MEAPSPAPILIAELIEENKFIIDNTDTSINITLQNNNDRFNKVININDEFWEKNKKFYQDSFELFTKTLKNTLIEKIGDLTFEINKLDEENINVELKYSSMFFGFTTEIILVKILSENEELVNQVKELQKQVSYLINFVGLNKKLKLIKTTKDDLYVEDYFDYNKIKKNILRYGTHNKNIPFIFIANKTNLVLDVIKNYDSYPMNYNKKLPCYTWNKNLHLSFNQITESRFEEEIFIPDYKITGVSYKLNSAEMAMGFKKVEGGVVDHGLSNALDIYFHTRKDIRKSDSSIVQFVIQDTPQIMLKENINYILLNLENYFLEDNNEPVFFNLIYE